jgi:hypothetical protein
MARRLAMSRTTDWGIRLAGRPNCGPGQASQADEMIASNIAIILIITGACRSPSVPVSCAASFEHLIISTGEEGLRHGDAEGLCGCQIGSPSRSSSIA